MVKTYFSSESVTEGHPDKLCDRVSDSILDAFLSKDKNSRVAVETLVTEKFMVIAGEVSSTAKIDIIKVAKDAIKDVGYTDDAYGFNADTCEIVNKVHQQSSDIAQGVIETKDKEQGAGDQGLMFGFACDETEELMPLPISLAHKLTAKLAEVRKSGDIGGLGPDGKSQVTVEYDSGKPLRIDAVVIAQQHIEAVSEEDLRQQILSKVIKPVCGKLLDEKTKIYINGTGKFVIGGPQADTGVTGRKIIVDTYGGMGRHGGGAFSGKDPSKVDRSAAYMCRHIAKNVVAHKLAKKCEVQVAYCIGIARPMGIFVDTFGTGSKSDDEIVKWIQAKFDLRPRAIVEYLELKNPVYAKTSAYGHFGRVGFSWEKVI